MKVLEFIKKNISVFSLTSISLIVLFFNILFFYEKKGTQQDIILVYSFLFIPLSMFILLIDVLFKTLIKSRMVINIIQILTLISILIYFEKHI